MNLVFNASEQLPELCLLAKENPLPGLTHLLDRKFWIEFMLQDAKNLLRHYLRGVKRRPMQHDLPAIFAKEATQLMHDLGGEQFEELTRAYRSPTEFIIGDKNLEHIIEDFIDEVYYDVHLELDDFIHGFMQRGDLWTCKAYDNHLLFTFCCNTSSVEAAVRASGGNFAEFIAHMTF